MVRLSVFSVGNAAGKTEVQGTKVLYISLPIISKAGFGFFNLMLLCNLPDSVKENIAHELDPIYPQEHAWRKSGRQQNVVSTA